MGIDGAKPVGASNQSGSPHLPRSPDPLLSQQQEPSLESTPRKKIDFLDLASQVSGKNTDKVLDQGFKWLVAPLSILSATSSVCSFISNSFFKNENWFIDKMAGLSNRASYFMNGIYSAINNACTNNLPGAIGYGLVSLASVIGNEDNMYLLKGPGSALDQLPAMLEDAADNPRIAKWFGLKPDKNNGFTTYNDVWDSVKKTIVSTGIICGDTVRELKEKLSKGFVTGILDTFARGGRKAEKNLVLSSLGLLTGSFLGLGLGFKRIGASIRDISGAYADLALFSKDNLWYKLCGGFYGLASFLDLIYRWTGIEKLNVAAVGLDNAGFCLMSYANAGDNQRAREKVRKQVAQEIVHPESTKEQQATGKPILGLT